MKNNLQKDIQLHSVSAGVWLDRRVIIFWKTEHYVIVVANVNAVIVCCVCFLDYPLLLLITSWEKSEVGVQGGQMSDKGWMKTKKEVGKIHFLLSLRWKFAYSILKMP